MEVKEEAMEAKKARERKERRKERDEGTGRGAEHGRQEF
jgi:hypothetical protein